MRSTYEAQLVAMANEVYSRPELDPESTDPGVHPATYGTEYFGTTRAAMPHLSDRDLPAFWDVEDEMIGKIESHFVSDDKVTDEIQDRYSRMAADLGVESLSYENEIAQDLHDSHIEAAGTTYALKKSGDAPETVQTATTIIRLGDALTQVAKAPRNIGVRKEASVNTDLGVERRRTARSWKDQTTAPKQALKLTMAQRTR